MDARKKRLKLIQLSMFLLGLIIIFFTYRQEAHDGKKVISTEIHKKVENQISSNINTGDVFYNIRYTGLDMSGNRYILKSKEAYNDKFNQEIVVMKSVDATFYFKDGSILNVNSNKGRYNNKSLDMVFEDNIKAKYNQSELFANKAEYSNKIGFLTISEKVKVKLQVISAGKSRQIGIIFSGILLLSLVSLSSQFLSSFLSFNIWFFSSSF